MNNTLCGRQYCPYICERVCYCPAGQERVRELGRRYSMRRALRRLVDPGTGEIVELPQAPIMPVSRTRRQTSRPYRFKPFMWLSDVLDVLFGVK